MRYNRPLTRRSRSAFLATAVVVLLLASAGGVDDRAEVLQRLEHSFGKPTDPKLQLWEIDPKYVLRPRFNKAGDLISINVGPKFRWSEDHPEWEDTGELYFLLTPEVESLLERIRTVKDFGAARDKHASIYVTNSRAPHADWYERGVVFWDEIVDVRYDEDRPPNRQVKDLTVFYLREFDATPTKVTCDKEDEYGSCHLWLDTREYILPAAKGRHLHAGVRAKFLAAGPIACQPEHCEE